MRCLVRLLVVIRAVLRNLTTTNGVSASHDLRFILNVQRDLSDLADLTVLATAIGLLRTQWQHPAMYAVVKAMRACFPPTPDGRAAAQGILESHPRTIPAVRSTAAVETVTLNMRTALAAVLLPHIVEHKQSASVRHDDVCAVLAALESTEIHDQHATHPPIVSALRYMPKTGQFALAPPILLNNKHDILLESVQEVLRLCVPTNCDCISIPWPSRTAGDDHFRVVHLRRPAEEDAKQQTLLGHARKRRRSSSSFRSSVISPATTPVAADQSMQGGLSDSSSKNLYLRWQRRSGVRETVGAEWHMKATRQALGVVLYGAERNRTRKKTGTSTRRRLTDMVWWAGARPLVQDGADLVSPGMMICLASPPSAARSDAAAAAEDAASALHRAAEPYAST